MLDLRVMGAISLVGGLLVGDLPTIGQHWLANLLPHMHLWFQSPCGD